MVARFEVRILYVLFIVFTNELSSPEPTKIVITS